MGGREESFVLVRPTLRWDFIERIPSGVQPFRIHDLRHSYVSLQRQAGTRLEVISANLGHANSNITRASISTCSRRIGRNPPSPWTPSSRGRAERASF